MANSTRSSPRVALNERVFWGTLIVIVGVVACTKTEGTPEGKQLGPDVFASGQDVRLRSPSEGDAIMAGGSVALDAPVQNDAVLAGGDVTLHAPVGGDVYAAGREVHLSSKVGGNARLAGESVSVRPQAEIAGGATIAGDRVLVAGTVRGYLVIMARDAQISGHVDGNVEVFAQELGVGPAAVVQGTVQYRGAVPAHVDPSARLAAGLTQVLDPEPWEHRNLQRALSIMFAFWVAGWVVVAMVWLWLWPRPLAGAAEVIRRRGVAALVAGLGLFLGTPLAAMALILSVLGAPLGLLLVATYVCAVPLGYLAAAHCFAVLSIERLKASAPVRKRLVALAVAAMIVGLSLIGSIPVLGQLVTLVVASLGMGGLTIALEERYRSPRPSG